MAHELRTCRECGGKGETTEIGNGPGDRPRLVSCGRCEGAGEALVWLYPRRLRRLARSG